ncbi:MAG: hypothetical protein ABS882_02350 [Lysinibacillus sp.]
MSLFFIKHKYGIHEVIDVVKRKTNIELKTNSNEILHIIVVTDDSYTVYDDRFAGASKKLNSLELFDIDGSFRNIDFDEIRLKFSEAFNELISALSTHVGKNAVIDLDNIRHEVSDKFTGLHFKIITDTNSYPY